MRNGILVIGLVVSGVACSDLSQQPGQGWAEDLWVAHGIRNYTIHQQQICFCGQGGATVLVTVVSDTIASVLHLPDSSVIFPGPLPTPYLTIDSLFATIRAFDKDTSSNTQYTVSYNAQYGYPESLDLNPHLHPVDGGILIVTSNLEVPQE